MGRALISIGLLILIIGIIWYAAEKYDLKFPGKLPGDILIKRGNTTIYIPILTSIILSVVLSLIMWLASRFKF
ncbi:membrane protein [Thermaurantimonas aggregans]|uniref:Membrane protein n=1 Tax=Thermaurantimonas aggregans TaxID=2173829 RepID=A0A401XIS3_9FLAO|nr:DUF2905 domain-containing protein [Thermaurantimonas aggregans]MCX8148834.1 DUF2905 domain-containing protein [Thermaurantimonas aggregans]GCD76891.1 membrane protein [Thermaurantimonas aggregans]